MNKKPETNPAKSLQLSHRLNAYVLILVAIVMLIPSKYVDTENSLFALLFVLIFGIVLVVLLIKIVISGKGLGPSHKGFYDSGDYLDEVMVKGVKYAWFAILAFMGFLMMLAAATNFLLSSEAIMRLSMAIIVGVPSIVFLLLTRNSAQEDNA